MEAAHLTSRNVCAIGDGMNDFEMLRGAGFAIAMSNGKNAVRDIADYITRDNDSDGVAHALQQLMLERKWPQ